MGQGFCLGAFDIEGGQDGVTLKRAQRGPFQPVDPAHIGVGAVFEEDDSVMVASEYFENASLVAHTDSAQVGADFVCGLGGGAGGSQGQQGCEGEGQETEPGGLVQVASPSGA